MRYLFLLNRDYALHRQIVIGLIMDAKGFERLITQHYPNKGSRGATFDLVIVPETESNVKRKDAFGH